jgi:hypothetical protein
MRVEGSHSLLICPALGLSLHLPGALVQLLLPSALCLLNEMLLAMLLWLELSLSDVGVLGSALALVTGWKVLRISSWQNHWIVENNTAGELPNLTDFF